MMKKTVGLLLISTVFLCSACSKEPEKNAEPKALTKAVTAPLEKAKGVENLLQQDAEQEGKRINEQLEKEAK